MKKLLLVFLASAFWLPPSAPAATAPLAIDTKTHALVAGDGSSVIDAKAVTLTVGGFTVSDASGVKTIVLGSVSGTKIGASGDKIGLFGVTPIARPTGNLFTALVNLGAVTSPTLTIANVTSLQSNLDTLSSTITANNAAALHIAGTETATGDKIFTGAFSTTGVVLHNSTGGNTFGINSSMSGSYPASANGSNAGFSLGQNFTGGGAESDLFNNNVGAAAGGFRFLQKTGTSSALDLMWLFGNGGVAIGSPSVNPGVGGLIISPGSPSVQGLHITTALTGSTPPIDWAANEIIINTDNAALTTFGSAFNIRHNFGGVAMAGGRNSLQIQSYLTAPTSGTGAGSGNYVAGYFGIDAQSGDNGTNLGAGAKGGIFAINPSATLKSGSTNMGELSGGEVNIAAETGSSVKYKNILSLVYNSTDAVSGTLYDTMLALSSQSFNGAANGILFGGMNGAQPIKNSGNLIATNGSYTVANGLYFPDYIFSGSAVYAPHGSATFSGVTSGPIGVTNNSPDSLVVTGAHSLYTGLRIQNTDGGGDWSINAGGSGWGGAPGALVITDNTPTTGGIRMIVTKAGDTVLGRAVYLSPQGSAPPAGEGEIYYNSSDKHFYGHNGTTWVRLDN